MKHVFNADNCEQCKAEHDKAHHTTERIWLESKQECRNVRTRDVQLLLKADKLILRAEKNMEIFEHEKKRRSQNVFLRIYDALYRFTYGRPYEPTLGEAKKHYPE